MLTRRHIRIKVMQSLFAMKQKESEQLETELSFLNNSMEQVLHLFAANLQLLIGLKKHASFLKAASKSKANDMVTLAGALENNQVLRLLEINQKLESIVETYKLDFWYLDDEYIKLIFSELQEQDFAQEYLKIEQPNFKEDRSFILDIFKQLVAPNEKLHDYIEDKNISWVDDMPVVNTAIVTFLKKLKKSDDDMLSLPSLVKDQEDLEFAAALFRKTKLHENKYLEIIDEKTPNWDRDRIAQLDILMIQMGICEFQKFPSIPVKVTINEYLELAKEYSTAKSNIFINGILDKISKEFSESGELKKIGRGLM